MTETTTPVGALVSNPPANADPTTIPVQWTVTVGDCDPLVLTTDQFSSWLSETFPIPEQRRQAVLSMVRSFRANGGAGWGKDLRLDVVGSAEHQH